MKNIILYDDICNLCNYSIQFIIKHDPKVYFHFASIQSSLGEALLEKYQLNKIDSLILIQDNQAFVYSDAVLHIAKGLQSWHRHFYLFHLLPKNFRDASYQIIAKYRYNFFGKRQSCIMPTAEIQSRFLD